MFTDDEFAVLMKELDQPQIDGWEFFTESHGISIYRLYNEVSKRISLWSQYRFVHNLSSIICI